jgi:hypothetical protein
MRQATHKEFSMRKEEFFDYSRRALLGASGALALFAELRPLRIFAQPSGGKLIADEVEREGIGITSQKYLPGTHLVRAFNTLSYTIFVREANRPDPKLAIPIAGDDGEALAVTAGLVRDAGFEPVVVGKLVDARRFQRGAPGYGQSVTAAELRQKLSLTP